MLYSILIYDSEAVVASWTKQEDDELVANHVAVQQGLAAEGKLGPVVRLMPTTAAVTLKPGAEPLVMDGPYAETKEALLGFYVLECATLEEVIEAARLLPNKSGAAVFEIRPICWFHPVDGLKELK